MCICPRCRATGHTRTDFHDFLPAALTDNWKYEFIGDRVTSYSLGAREIYRRLCFAGQFETINSGSCGPRIAPLFVLVNFLDSPPLSFTPCRSRRLRNIEFCDSCNACTSVGVATRDETVPARFPRFSRSKVIPRCRRSGIGRVTVSFYAICALPWARGPFTINRLSSAIIRCSICPASFPGNERLPGIESFRRRARCLEAAEFVEFPRKRKETPSGFRVPRVPRHGTGADKKPRCRSLNEYIRIEWECPHPKIMSHLKITPIVAAIRRGSGRFNREQVHWKPSRIHARILNNFFRRDF